MPSAQGDADGVGSPHSSHSFQLFTIQMPAALGRVYTRARLGRRLASGAGNDRGERLDLMETLQSAVANLTSPAVLFFLMGMLAGAARSELSLPDQAAKTLSL